MKRNASGDRTDSPRSRDRRRFLASAALGGATLTLGAVSIAGSRGRAEADVQPLTQSTLDSLAPGEHFALSPGRYRQDGILTVHTPGVTINGNGSELVATDESRSAFYVRADGVSIANMIFSTPNTTKRWEGLDQHRITILNATAVELHNVDVRGSAAAGIFIGGGANHFLLESPTVSQSRADGIHMTDGAHDGSVVNARVDRSGDDGVAVVSYDKDQASCHSIHIESPVVADQTWGRGVAIVGGDGISVNNVRVSGSSSAGIYVGIEGAPYFTRSTSNVRINSGSLANSNQSAEVQQGAIVVYSGRPGQSLTNVVISDISIQSTRTDSPRQVSVLLQNGGAASNIRFDRIIIDSATPIPFFTNAGPDAATLDGWVVAGSPYPVS